jgi:hypothetical protein
MDAGGASGANARLHSLNLHSAGCAEMLILVMSLDRPVRLQISGFANNALTDG